MPHDVDYPDTAAAPCPVCGSVVMRRWSRGYSDEYHGPVEEAQGYVCANPDCDWTGPPGHRPPAPGPEESA